VNPDLLAWIDKLAGLRIAVLGDAMLDVYLDGNVQRFCQEAPAPVVAVGERVASPGGAANTAVNAHALGGRVHFVSVTGDDAEGESLLQTLKQRGISTNSVIVCRGRQTMSKHRVRAASQLMLRFDQGCTKPISPYSEQLLIDLLRAVFPVCDVIIISDYGYGVLTPRVRQTLAELQRQRPRIVVADSRRLEVFRDIGLTAAKPNFDEAIRLLDGQLWENRLSRSDGLSRHGERLMELTGAGIVAATLDSEGVVVFERGRPPCHIPAMAPRQACVVGAGDTFTAALALTLAAGASGCDAAELASAAAAVAVGKERTAICTAAELREFICAGSKYLGDPARAASRAEFLRQQGRRIVFTNGCFDILHRGHVMYLHRAKALGDVLIVGVNTDAGIHRLKGPQRPINTLEDRLQVLAALSCVDHLIAFDDDTPCALIRAIRPDVFVKGGDYTRERLPEALLVEALGGTVQILPFLADRSTTGLIHRIRSAESLVAGGTP
jgi:D-beta-D-heptose 7-phosphate kinase/D-beta-D-heptose 1-phosphate adenosyltransferase